MCSSVWSLIDSRACDAQIIVGLSNISRSVIQSVNQPITYLFLKHTKQYSTVHMTAQDTDGLIIQHWRMFLQTKII